MNENNCKPSVFPDVLCSPNNSKIHDRLIKLKQKFISKFSLEPDVYIRVPGRVNLIGEHVDYCGYSVCPMAIEQDILLAAKAVNTGPFLEITNLDSEYVDHIVLDTDFVIDLKKIGWCAYVLCGIRGALERIGKTSISLRFGFAGTIPPGSGLSSSSGLVSASLLGTVYLNKFTFPKTELANMSAICERYIGTAGGGMDQAIAFCATEGCAKHIEFNPLRTADVLLPQDAVFVIANSLVTKNKAESDDFNTRVVETRLVAQVLGKKYQLTCNGKMRIAAVQAELEVGFDKIVAIIKETFHKEPYTREELCKELGLSEEELSTKVLTPDTKHLNHFKLYSRGLHVVEEAFRVQEWMNSDTIQTLGKLMNASHQSLKDLYEASHPSLDKLVENCLEGGALGARLTGAGWGGAVVCITTPCNVNNLIESLKKTYYSDFKGDINNVVFATQPGPGAQIFTSV